ncbi:class I SAM-dependent methyltransferase [Amylibacter sp.]|nr:class I SAM-dependent methyltransferase [Amylibacter sp.]MDB2393910.1 class I SAM-dependent methyltransferase [bacterium]MDB2443199.1 class I SAM-dependent methyltransferase [Amylibacter sp.]
MNNPSFHDYSKFYDLLYSDKNYLLESDYIHNILIDHNISCGDLLEFGCGTGKHARILCERNYSVHGIEKSKEMVNLANMAKGFTIHNGDICSYSLDRKFDAVLSLFHVISYQTKNDDLQSVFRNAASHLKSGGLFIFDFWFSPAVYENKPSIRIKNVSNTKFELTRIAEPTEYPSKNQVEVKYTIFALNKKTGVYTRLDETHVLRHYSLPEIDYFAEIAGFERVNAEEFLTKHPPSVNAWGVCVTLKKR